MKIAGSSEMTRSGRTKNPKRRIRSPLPIRRLRYAQIEKIANASAAMSPAARSGVRSIEPQAIPIRRCPPPTESLRRLAEGFRSPLRHGVDDVCDHAILVAPDDLEHRLDERLREERRLEPELEKLVCVGL